MLQIGQADRRVHWTWWMCTVTAALSCGTDPRTTVAAPSNTTLWRRMTPPRIPGRRYAPPRIWRLTWRDWRRDTATSSRSRLLMPRGSVTHLWLMAKSLPKIPGVSDLHQVYMYICLKNAYIYFIFILSFQTILWHEVAWGQINNELCSLFLWKMILCM